MHSPTPHFTHWLPKGQSLWFVEWMQQALYHPQYGYYTRPQSPIGKTGDFITAPEMTPLFGKTLATYLEKAFSLLTQPIVFEFGAGLGKLCVDILMQLEARHALPERYLILEASHQLQRRQAEYIAAQIPHLASRVEWLARWPEDSFEGVVIANEVLDAMPVHRFKIENGKVLESRVIHTEKGELEESFEPCPHPRIEQHIRSRFTSLDTPYLSECNGMIEGWLSECSRMLKKGVVLLIDYGFPAHEYYHEDRNQGTLMCHYHHQAHPNPLIHVGEQDITAHVDFTHVAEAAVAAKLDVSWFTNQASFLLDNGMLTHLEQIQDETCRIKANQHVKPLLSHAEMGELFKVMILSKELDPPACGSYRHDQRGRL